MKFHILIFGCQMNYADSARIKAVLTNCWFFYTPNIKEADIVIFDTCSVRQKSEDKITGKLKEINKNQKIRITGCMIQHNIRSGKLKVWSKKLNDKFQTWNFLWAIKSKNPKILWLTTNEINKLDIRHTSDITVVWINNAFNPIFHNLRKKRKNIELFYRIDDTWFLPLILKKLWYKIKYDKELINEYEKIIPEWFNTSMNKHNKTAYIPISTGCNQFCSYCIVPYARWLEKHFPVEQIIDEAKKHLKSWCKEIVLLWQIVNKHPDFVQICKKILKLKWLQRLRYTSPYPTYYSDELLRLHEKEKKLCPHIHIPLQSWSDEVLKKMFRWYSFKQAKEFINKIRSLKRNISITTDIIVWFAGESEEDFQQTLNLVEYGKFDMIYIWIYSPRQWTLAERKYENNIPYKIKHERWTRLNNLLNKISLENNQKEIWNIRAVLINELSILSNSQDKFSGILLWYTDNAKQVIITNNKKIKVWDFVKVKITNGIAFKLYWEII